MAGARLSGVGRDARAAGGRRARATPRRLLHAGPSEAGRALAERVARQSADLTVRRARLARLARVAQTTVLARLPDHRAGPRLERPLAPRAHGVVATRHHWRAPVFADGAVRQRARTRRGKDRRARRRGRALRDLAVLRRRVAGRGVPGRVRSRTIARASADVRSTDLRFVGANLRPRDRDVLVDRCRPAIAALSEVHRAVGVCLAARDVVLRDLHHATRALSTESRQIGVGLERTTGAGASAWVGTHLREVFLDLEVIDRVLVARLGFATRAAAALRLEQAIARLRAGLPIGLRSAADPALTVSAAALARARGRAVERAFAAADARRRAAIEAERALRARGARRAFGAPAVRAGGASDARHVAAEPPEAHRRRAAAGRARPALTRRRAARCGPRSSAPRARASRAGGRLSDAVFRLPAAGEKGHR